MDRKVALLFAAWVSACPAGTDEICEPACRAGFECIAGECLADVGSDPCEPACRSGYTCQSGACVASGGSECNPACRSGYTCQAGQCLPVQQQAPGVEVVELGSVSFGGEGVGTVQLDIPADAISFHIAASTAQHVDLSGVFRLIAPDGQVLFEITRPEQYALRFNPGDGEAQILFPNTPLVSIMPGRYQIEFVTNADQISTYDVQAIIKRGAPKRTGRLDLNLFFVGVPGLTSFSAPNDPAFQRLISRFAQLYAQAGIAIGDIRYLDANAADSDRLGVIDSIEGAGNELDQLFGLADQYTNDDHFNFYLVRSISAGGSDGLEILGIADGIPGRPSLAGQRRSGVAVTMGYYQQDPESVASTMAHEGGHFLGLFHTSERDGSLHDPLPDTPQCLRSADQNGDGLLDAGECAAIGAQNLMFWLSAPSAVQFTQDQIFVLHQNPAIR